MRCRNCNGEVNLAVGRCTVCGQPVDDAAKSRILQNLDQLADQYNIDYDNIDSKTEDIPEIMRVNRKQETEKKKEEKSDPNVRPTFDEERFRRLAGITEDDLKKEEQPEEETPELQEEQIEEESSQDSESEDDYEPSNPVLRGLKNAYMKLDKAITPATDRLLAFYRKHVPRKNRVKHSPLKERLAIMLIALALIVVTVVLVLTIVSCIPDNPVGVWETSENLTVEFTNDDRVIVRAVTESGEVCIIKEGIYRTQCKNSKSSLIIEYEDGTQSILYYSIEGDKGTFTNIGNGKAPAVYYRQ
ncbi:MAG: hypothetical protein E7546_02865 [Ruminococcaceae bacterium]|nr:hypothetical protein [Oscillospiraceae bacterium]